MSSESVSTLETSSVTNLKGKVPKCLIACSGSVATLKIPELVAELSLHFEVMIICTTSAAFFLEKAQVYNEDAWKKFEIAGGWNLVLKDEDEWQMWNTIGAKFLYPLPILPYYDQPFFTCLGNSVLHIEMRRWADVLIVAPASANVIAKSSYGIADNFVLSVMRAWDFRKPCILCPAMNTVMWTHPSTQESLSRLQAWGWMVLDPKRPGMASVHNIRTCLFRALGIPDESVIDVKRGTQLSTQVVRKCFFTLKKLHCRKKVLVKYHTVTHSMQTEGDEKEDIKNRGLVRKANAWEVFYLNASFYVGIATGWWLTGKALSYAIQYALSSSSGYDI